MATVISDPVSVDDRFVRVGSKSYAVNKITSVDLREDTRSTLGRAIGLAALAVLCAGVAVAGAGILIIGSVAFAAMAYKAWEATRRETFRLFLVLTSTEAQAFTTHDRAEAEFLRERIEEAMASA